MIAPALQARLNAAGRGDDDAIAIGDAALALSGAVRGRTETEAHDRHLTALADGVAGYMRGTADTLDLRAEALARILANHYGYGATPDTADDDAEDAGLAEDACLLTVIDRRHGSGLAVGILYLDVARRLGWLADGLDFPGRFLIRLSLGADRRILDPQGGGQPLAPHALRALLKETAGTDAELSPAHYRPMDNRAILFRYHNDLKMRLLRQGRLEDALRAVEAMLLAAPAAAVLWREAGMMHARLDNVPAAVVALEHYLTVADEEDGRYRASLLLRDLRQQDTP